MDWMASPRTSKRALSGIALPPVRAIVLLSLASAYCILREEAYRKTMFLPTCG